MSQGNKDRFQILLLELIAFARTDAAIASGEKIFHKDDILGPKPVPRWGRTLIEKRVSAKEKRTREAYYRWDDLRRTLPFGMPTLEKLNFLEIKRDEENGHRAMYRFLPGAVDDLERRIRERDERRKTRP
jgi:hypothetical protein